MNIIDWVLSGFMLAILLIIVFSGAKKVILFGIKILEWLLNNYWCPFIVCSILYVVMLLAVMLSKYKDETICNIPIIAIIFSVNILNGITAILMFIYKKLNR